MLVEVFYYLQVQAVKLILECLGPVLALSCFKNEKAF